MHTNRFPLSRVEDRFRGSRQRARTGRAPSRLQVVVAWERLIGRHRLRGPLALLVATGLACD